jgi:GT2 family glycosyltransferase
VTGPSPGTGAIVIHYRRWPEVRLCIDALLEQSCPPGEVVVVDNRSADGSAEQIRAAYPDLTLIEAPENRGYAAGVNLGMNHLRRSTHDSFLVVTHECVLAPDTLEQLAARLGDATELGAVGPLLGYRSDRERVFSAGGRIDGAHWWAWHAQKPTGIAEWDGVAPRNVDWLDGSCVLYRRATVEDIGPLDEDYFMYFEELDYFVRMTKAGWRVECVPAARAWQEPGPVPTYLWTRNRLRFLTRNATRAQVAREMLRLVRRTGRRLGNEPDGSSRNAAERAALRDFLLRRSGPPAEDRRPPGSPVGP